MFDILNSGYYYGNNPSHKQLSVSKAETKKEQEKRYYKIAVRSLVIGFVSIALFAIWANNNIGNYYF